MRKLAEFVLYVALIIIQLAGRPANPAARPSGEEAKHIERRTILFRLCVCRPPCARLHSPNISSISVDMRTLALRRFLAFVSPLLVVVVASLAIARASPTPADKLKTPLLAFSAFTLPAIDRAYPRFDRFINLDKVGESDGDDYFVGESEVRRRQFLLKYVSNQQKIRFHQIHANASLYTICLVYRKNKVFNTHVYRAKSNDRLYRHFSSTSATSQLAAAMAFARRHEACALESASVKRVHTVVFIRSFNLLPRSL